MIGEEVIAVYVDAGDGEELFEVQKLVRCKDCKHWSQAPKTSKGWCDRLDGLLDPTWYCADGKRRSE